MVTYLPFRRTAPSGLCPTTNWNRHKIWFLRNPHYSGLILSLALRTVVSLQAQSSRRMSSGPTPPARKELFPYQLDGVEKLVDRKRLLLADEMGLGKTIQCIEALNRIGTKDSTILIVCPKSVLGVWQSELETWLQPELISSWEIHVASTKAKPLLPPGSITLINYDICHKLRQLLQKPRYDVLICDEAHYLKSLEAKRTQTILGQAQKGKAKQKAGKGSPKRKSDTTGIRSKFLWLLTGTPVLNRPVELFPLVHAIAPKKFPGFYDYANKYCDPQIKTVYTRQGVVISTKDYSGASNLKELSKRLEPIMLRRHKMDVLPQLPPKVRSCTCLTTDIDIAHKERELLKKTLMENVNARTALAGQNVDLDDFSSNAAKLIKYIDTDDAILAQIAAVRQETALAKVKPSIELLEEYVTLEKVVVFAHHRAVIDELMEHFGDRAVCIKGGMKREDRDEAVRKFQEDSGVRLFVGSIRAAGVGLTLTAASHVVFLELDWSPAVMSQAEDRCHRVGQSNSVRIQYFVFKDTIDEWLSKSLLFKQNNIDEILPEKQAGDGDETTGYVFDFGRHEGIRVEEVPRSYVQFLLKEEIYRKHPSLWRALAKMGLVLDTPEDPAEKSLHNGSSSDSASNNKDELKKVDYVFDFGKHRGKNWEDVPEDYRDWLMREKVWESRQNLLDALTDAGFEPPEMLDALIDVGFESTES